MVFALPLSPQARRRLAGAALALAGAALLARVIANAWVCDDAFISFRVVDNVLHGYGLRWNVDERVEVYTHPLWLLLHIPVVALTGNPFLGTLVLSVVSSALAVLVALASCPGRPGVALLALLLPLLLSRCFVEYSTSGLENPLSFLLFAGFAALALRRSEAPPGLALGLLAGLAACNRLDTALLYLPPLALLLWAWRGRVRWGALALGLSPLLGWQIFRMLYYGFALPNTKYAKLDAGIGAADSVRQGLHYAMDLALRDPASLVALLLGLGAALAAALSARGPRDRRALLGAVGAGVLLYLAYVVRVGGDFMSGRFFSLPVFACAWLLLAFAWPLPRPRFLAGCAAALVLAQLAAPVLRPLRQGRHWGGINDERSFYAPSNALFERGGGIRSHVGGHPWVDQGLRLRAGAEPPLLVHGAVGMLGYYAGPAVRIIDPTGLTDPLLARLPAERRHHFRVGHLKRRVPPGYLKARETGSLDAMEPKLAERYARLRLVTSGPILDPARLRAIVELARDAPPWEP